MTIGVPQCSVLPDPYCFSIYINVFEDSTSVFDLFMYADATSLFCILDAVPEAKRDVMFFTLRQHKLLARLCMKVLCTILTINNTVIERGVNFKFLGPLWTWQITVTWIFFKNVFFIIYLYVFIYYIFLPYHLSYSFSTMIQCVTNLRGIANY